MKSDIVYCVDDGKGGISPNAANFFFNLGRLSAIREYRRDLVVVNEALDRLERLLQD